MNPIPLPRAVRAAWRLLARLHPRDVLREDGAEMEATFAARYHAATEDRRWFLVRELAALVRAGIGERIGARRRGRRLERGASLFVAQDVRYAFRQLARTPTFTVLTVAVLAGGLGISIFTHAFLRRAVTAPVPLDGGDRIVRLNLRRPDRGFGRIDASAFARARPAILTLTGIGVYSERSLTVGAVEGGLSFDATATEWTLFATARRAPLLGRTLVAADQGPGAAPVVVLSHRLWRNGFGGDSGVVGRTVELSGVPTRVVGVMPDGFEFPVAADAWIPIDPVLLDPDGVSGAGVDVFARIAEGADRGRAEAELAVLMARAAAERPPPPGEPAPPTAVAVRSFPEAQVGDEGTWLVGILNGLAALILLLACINVGNLLLARANERRTEMAVRLALGASRPRLVMQHLWETIFICVTGGALATVLAVAGLRLVDAWARTHLDGNLAFWWRWGYDPTVLVASGAFVAVAIAVIGTAVSLRATRGDFLDTVRAGAAPTAGRESTRWSSALVITQVVVVSVVLFVGVLSGSLGRRILSIDVGHDTDRLLRTGFLVPGTYSDRTEIDALRHRVVAALLDRSEIQAILLQARIAGIESEEGEVEIPGGPTDREARPRAWITAAEGPLATLGVATIEGRFLESGDDTTAAPVAVLSQSLAGRLWPGQSAVGRQVRLAAEGPAALWRTVVGVVGDVPLDPNPLARRRTDEAVWVPLGQAEARGLALFVKYRTAESAAQQAILAAIATVDPALEVVHPQSFEEMLEKSALMTTATARMFGGCFLFALLLAVSGTYGLVARAIGRRTREIGIRRALGASDGRILRLLVWQGGRHLVLGAVIALPLTAAAALGVTRVFPIEPALALASAVGASAIVAAVVLGATWLPTRRAVRIEPRDALWRNG